MGSLRSMGSLRGLSSSPLKERAKERSEEPVVESQVGVSYRCRPADVKWNQSPCTPVHTTIEGKGTRPSLMLNFERTPPDQPMFGALRRKQSSSSLKVHHSSPVPIPTLGKLDDLPTSISVHAQELPRGTVPNTPAPLQMALERDPVMSGSDLDSRPVHSRIGNYAEPPHRPILGANPCHEADDTIGVELSRVEQGASLSGLIPKSSSYFTIPVVDKHTRPHSDSISVDPDQKLDYAAQEAYLINTMADECISISGVVAEADKAGMHVSQTDRCDSMLAQCIHQDEKVHHAKRPVGGQYACDRCQFNERASMGQGSSPIGIEHILFNEDPEEMATNQMPSHQKYPYRQAQAQRDMQKRVADLNVESFPVLDMDPKPAQSTWGTHGSLYDGTGYGDTQSSSSARPSTSSTVPGSPLKTTCMVKTGFDVASLAEESAAMARDHETLEEVIRAYAALEDEGSSGISDEILEGVVADVQLANDMANHSLGA